MIFVFSKELFNFSFMMWWLCIYSFPILKANYLCLITIKSQNILVVSMYKEAKD